MFSREQKARSEQHTTPRASPRTQPPASTGSQSQVSTQDGRPSRSTHSFLGAGQQRRKAKDIALLRLFVRPDFISFENLDKILGVTPSESDIVRDRKKREKLLHLMGRYHLINLSRCEGALKPSDRQTCPFCIKPVVNSGSRSTAFIKRCSRTQNNSTKHLWKRSMSTQQRECPITATARQKHRHPRCVITMEEY